MAGAASRSDGFSRRYDTTNLTNNSIPNTRPPPSNAPPSNAPPPSNTPTTRQRSLHPTTPSPPNNTLSIQQRSLHPATPPYTTEPRCGDAIIAPPRANAGTARRAIVPASRGVGCNNSTIKGVEDVLQIPQSTPQCTPTRAPISQSVLLCSCLPSPRAPVS